MKIRLATHDEIGAMCRVEGATVDREKRREFVPKLIHKGTAHVAVLNGTMVGVAVLEHWFFERGFISLLMVRRGHRRRGVGSALVRHVEILCESERIFTSTNQSNLPMQSLLKKLGYRKSGTVDDLDPDDPELFYSRQLR